MAGRDLEEKVFAEAEQLLTDPNAVSIYLSETRAKQLPRLEAEREAKEAELDDIPEKRMLIQIAYERKADTLTEYAANKKRLAELEAKLRSDIATLSEEIAREEADRERVTDVEAVIAEVRRKWPRLDRKQRHKVLRRLGTRITVGPMARSTTRC